MADRDYVTAPIREARHPNVVQVGRDRLLFCKRLAQRGISCCFLYAVPGPLARAATGRSHLVRTFVSLLSSLSTR